MNFFHTEDPCNPRLEFRLLLNLLRKVSAPWYGLNSSLLVAAQMFLIIKKEHVNIWGNGVLDECLKCCGGAVGERGEGSVPPLGSVCTMPGRTSKR